MFVPLPPVAGPRDCRSAHRRPSFLLVLGLVCLVLSASAAQAQDDARSEARTRFERGVELFDEEHFEQALVEFRRAYELAPNPVVLFNIAQVYGVLGQAVEAIDAYGRYLAEAPSVDAARRREVQREITRLEARVARLDIRVDAEGATITIDDVVVGRSPIEEQVRVTVGAHVVVGVAAGRQQARLRIEVAAGDVRVVELSLPVLTSQAGLRVESRVPGVAIEVDGAAVGVTPLESTVPVTPGTHRVVGTRPGYVTTERTVTVEEGAELQVALAMPRDAAVASHELGTLDAQLPDTEFRLLVDGVEEAAGARRLTLPPGAHEVLLEVAEREPYSETVEISAGAVVRFEPQLRWQPEARQSRRAAAESMRVAGWALLLGGLPLAGAGTGVLIWGESEFAAGADLRTLAASCSPFLSETTGERPASCQRDLEERGFAVGTLVQRAMTLIALNRQFQSETDQVVALRIAGGVMAGVGGAALITGVILLLAAPSDEAIDSGASASLMPRIGVGPGTLSISGQF